MIFRAATRPADEPDAELTITEYRGTDWHALRAVADSEMPEGWVRVWVQIARG